MLRIRLTRTGKKHQPTYRIVVAEHSAPIKGKFIDIVGYYLPTRTPKILEVDGEKVKHWISKGAQASDTVHNLLVTKGVLTTKRNIKYSRIKTKEDPKAEETKLALVTPEVEKSIDESVNETPVTEPVSESKNPDETPVTNEVVAEKAPTQ